MRQEVRKIRAKTGGAPLTEEEEEKVKKLDRLMAGEDLSLQSYSRDYRYLEVPKYSTVYIDYIPTITKFILK